MASIYHLNIHMPYRMAYAQRPNIIADQPIQKICSSRTIKCMMLLNSIMGLKGHSRVPKRLAIYLELEDLDLEQLQVSSEARF